MISAQRRIAWDIATVPATTVAGLHVRALILADDLIDEEDENSTTDKLMIWSIVRD